MVSIAAFQAVDLGSIPGQRIFLIYPFPFSYGGTNHVENVVVQFFSHNFWFHHILFACPSSHTR